jgi:hypothetical protein
MNMTLDERLLSTTSFRSDRTLSLSSLVGSTQSSSELGKGRRAGANGTSVLSIQTTADDATLSLGAVRQPKKFREAGDALRGAEEDTLVEVSPVDRRGGIANREGGCHRGAVGDTWRLG